jgi:hypothetical protein
VNLHDYFNSLVSQMEREKFSSDDLLREGFAEAVPKGIVKLRVVEKIQGAYNELLVEDGTLICR